MPINTNCCIKIRISMYGHQSYYFNGINNIQRLLKDRTHINEEQ